jgi:hypothetical protein
VDGRPSERLVYSPLDRLASIRRLTTLEEDGFATHTDITRHRSFAPRRMARVNSCWRAGASLARRNSAVRRSQPSQHGQSALAGAHCGTCWPRGGQCRTWPQALWLGAEIDAGRNEKTSWLADTPNAVAIYRPHCFLIAPIDEHTRIERLQKCIARLEKSRHWRRPSDTGRPRTSGTMRPLHSIQARSWQRRRHGTTRMSRKRANILRPFIE